MNRTKKILIWTAVALFAAAQAVGLFLLMRPVPAASLTLSETAIALRPDEGRVVGHTVAPAAAQVRRVSYSVSSRIVWVDAEHDMIVALEPGTCRVRASLDGLEAIVDVTVSGETVLKGEWTGGGQTLLLDGALSGTLSGEPLQWTRSAFYEGETTDAARFVKLTAVRDGVLFTLYYDRLNDTMRLRANGEAGVDLVRS